MHRAGRLSDAPSRGEARPGLRVVQDVDGAQSVEPVRIVTAGDFAAVEEAGADPILGAPGEVVFPEGGDAMIYGDGGASKTTLGIDGACHFAAGDDWLGIPVPKPVRVLLIEAEGPRPLFRDKLRRKLDAWAGSDLGNRLLVMETPWAEFHFPDADEIADLIGELEVDVLIVGPLTRLGMDELGTLQQVRDFMDEVAKFRKRTTRRLLVILIHHENKGGSVSGAWEGAGDTLLHATVNARGKTTLRFQKLRWSSDWHKATLELDWTEGEGFEPVRAAMEERDLGAEIEALLTARPHLTAKEIARPKEEGGVGANVGAVKKALEADPGRFRSRTGDEAKAVGRHSTATVWEVARGSESPESLDTSGDRAGEGDSVTPPYRESPSHQPSPPRTLLETQAAKSPEPPAPGGHGSDGAVSE
jgi:hypothetical protein